LPSYRLRSSKDSYNANTLRMRRLGAGYGIRDGWVGLAGAKAGAVDRDGGETAT